LRKLRPSIIYISPDEGARKRIFKMIFVSARPLSFDDLLAADWERFDIQIMQGVGPDPVLYLCSAGSALRACLDEKANCIFVVPHDGPMPWRVFETIGHIFDCGVDLLIDGRGRSVRSFEQRDAVVSFLGVNELGSSESVLQLVRGKSHKIEPGTRLYEQAQIAKAVVEKNPILAEEKNEKLLLLLTEDQYETRNPPFAMLLRNKSSIVAKLIADSLMEWAASESKRSEASVDPG
jgi:hypothetical protein